MRKTILVVLMAVMIATPCLAEVKTESIFSLNETLWKLCALVIHTDGMLSFSIDCDSEMGFYQGNVYSYGFNYGEHWWGNDVHYIDLGVLSIAFSKLSFSPFFIVSDYFLAIMQPIGLGVFSWRHCEISLLFPGYKYCDDSIGIMFKINDNWTPPEIE